MKHPTNPAPRAIGRPSPDLEPGIFGVTRDAVCVVVTETVTGICAVPFRLVDDGVTEQVAKVGAPVHPNVTVLLEPVQPATCKLYVAAPPADTVAVIEPPDAADQIRSPLTVMLTVAIFPSVPLFALKVKLSAPANPDDGV